MDTGSFAFSNDIRLLGRYPPPQRSLPASAGDWRCVGPSSTILARREAQNPASFGLAKGLGSACWRTYLAIKKAALLDLALGIGDRQEPVGVEALPAQPLCGAEAASTFAPPHTSNFKQVRRRSALPTRTGPHPTRHLRRYQLPSYTERGVLATRTAARPKKGSP